MYIYVVVGSDNMYIYVVGGSYNMYIYVVGGSYNMHIYVVGGSYDMYIYVDGGSYNMYIYVDGGSYNMYIYVVGGSYNMYMYVDDGSYNKHIYVDGGSYNMYIYVDGWSLWCVISLICVICMIIIQWIPVFVSTPAPVEEFQAGPINEGEVFSHLYSYYYGTPIIHHNDHPSCMLEGHHNLYVLVHSITHDCIWKVKYISSVSGLTVYNPYKVHIERPIDTGLWEIHGTCVTANLIEINSYTIVCMTQIWLKYNI